MRSWLSECQPSGISTSGRHAKTQATAPLNLGQALGWYQPGQGAGFIASIVGAVLILLVWGFIARRTQ